MATQTTFINNLLNAAFHGGTYTGGTIRMALFKTGLPSSTGVEISGGSYARQTISFNTAGSKKILSSADVTFTNMPTGAGNTVVAFGIYDSTTLIDEGLLSTPFTADATNSEIKLSYTVDWSGV